MSLRRVLFIVGGALGLASIYLFQLRMDFYSVLFEFRLPQLVDYTAMEDIPTIPFIVNKVLRYLLNDLFSIAIIYGLFYERKYARFAMYVMFFGLFVLVPIYIILFLNQPAGFSSMLTHLHRIVMNPVLMMLLIPAFFVQRKQAEAKLS